MYLFKHPQNVCMDYFEHFKFSSNLGIIFLKASLKAFIHAILPDCYISSSSDHALEVLLLIDESGCKKDN
tara:strand:+ start:172 stop:381 length:210 start_codon:yes stop_codon:yes gene_type:complete